MLPPESVLDCAMRAPLVYLGRDANRQSGRTFCSESVTLGHISNQVATPRLFPLSDSRHRFWGARPLAQKPELIQIPAVKYPGVGRRRFDRSTPGSSSLSGTKKNSADSQNGRPFAWIRPRIPPSVSAPAVPLPREPERKGLHADGAGEAVLATRPSCLQSLPEAQRMGGL